MTLSRSSFFNANNKHVLIYLISNEKGGEINVLWNEVSSQKLSLWVAR